MMKTLIKIDVLAYIIMSLVAFIGGLYLITRTHETVSTGKNVEEMFMWLGGFALLIGLGGFVVTYIKIKDTYFIKQ